MLRLILAGIAAALALMNRKNPPLGFYWGLVCAYWTLNAIKATKDRR